MGNLNLFNFDQEEMGRWGDGGMKRWGNGEMRRWGDEEMGGWVDGGMGVSSYFFPPDSVAPLPSWEGLGVGWERLGVG
ncbi:hypothetical protein [Okeania sp. SIO2B3]|uniref:hypothetical protein n=1 Tax=Okeania sp. SIO2B3 TaxID=2607784 RepID=UPI0025D5F6D2|nr:hypothetical protein [Okeania sp. SIO2B3]